MNNILVPAVGETEETVAEGERERRVEDGCRKRETTSTDKNRIGPNRIVID